MSDDNVYGLTKSTRDGNVATFRVTAVRAACVSDDPTLQMGGEGEEEEREWMGDLADGVPPQVLLDRLPPPPSQWAVTVRRDRAP